MGKNTINNKGILATGNSSINIKNASVGNNNCVGDTTPTDKSPARENMGQTQDTQQAFAPSDSLASPGQSLQKIEVFFCYSHQDKKLRDKLDLHLSTLKRRFSISDWYDGKITPGSEWEREIDIHINRAHIILLLVSQDFIASDFCYEKEMKRALERHAAGEAIVIPILLRSCLWEETPLSKLQVLPTGAKPITTWSNLDEAFSDVARGIQRAINSLVRV